MRRSASVVAGVLLLLLPATPGSAADEIAPGVWRFTFGSPEAITPVRTRHFAPSAEGLARLPAAEACPVAVNASVSGRGMLISVPLTVDERVYGLGLQLMSFEQRSKKKLLRVNADPSTDTGDSHAPAPFYVTSQGYGVFVDTARYVTIYAGNKRRKPLAPPSSVPDDGRVDGWNGIPPYERAGRGESSEVLIEVPRAQGVDVYVFAGPSLREAVQRYNLWSGGGVVPPRWGLGFWYRVQTDFTQDEVLRLASEFRERSIPCDVLGLEPRWQSHAYSSSYRWGQGFPDPAAMLRQLRENGYRVNLWEQAFVHPTSPIYAALLPHSGDFTVWSGLVPDFLTREARSIFGTYHDNEHVALGVAGYKADECDNSDFTGNWSFPEIARFPSGADGEQMHSLFGLRYQDAILGVFEGRRQRTYGLVRSSGSLAAPYPFVLYSDLYQHSQFIHGVAQASFSGLLWTPEVRDATDPVDLIRRLQTTVCSPLAMINAWYLRNPPWRQVNRARNNAGDFAPAWEGIEAVCRSIIELRMQLVPYLHAAFVRYAREGVPPFRALVMDFPDDPETFFLSDQYMMGEDLLVAPIASPDRGPRGRAVNVESELTTSGEGRRRVYLPGGEWYDFWTGEWIEGGRRIEIVVPLERIPIFVRAGTILPLARSTLHTDDPAGRKLTATVYGDGGDGCFLYEDDGGWSPALTAVRLSWDPLLQVGTIDASLAPGASGYSVTAWKQVR